MTDNPYDRKMVIEQDYLHDYFPDYNGKEFTVNAFADYILSYIPIGARIYIEEEHGYSNDSVYFWVKYSRPETDEEMNERIYRYEQSNAKNEIMDKIIADITEEKERAELKRLKEKYEND